LSPLLAMKSVFPSGVMAMACGCAPVATAFPVCDTAPLVRLMLYDLTIWSPAVATHIDAVVVEAEFLAVAQPFNPAMHAIASAASAQRDIMRILLP
jgi:hypothetical protein